MQRLMGFPENKTEGFSPAFNSPSTRRKMLGNSFMIPQIAYVLLPLSKIYLGAIKAKGTLVTGGVLKDPLTVAKEFAKISTGGTLKDKYTGILSQLQSMTGIWSNNAGATDIFHKQPSAAPTFTRPKTTPKRKASKTIAVFQIAQYRLP